ncbi:MAG TPA: hypothetical protein VF746_15060 [Longimicrobium sp.]|jgi:hypothetical protein
MKSRKLGLDLSELKVETFETGEDGAARRGTVRLNQLTPEPCCTWSCGGTCGAQPDTTLVKEGYTKPLSCYPQQCCV